MSRDQVAQDLCCPLETPGLHLKVHGTCLALGSTDSISTTANGASMDFLDPEQTLEISTAGAPGLSNTSLADAGHLAEKDH